jgi:hypothetical protein
MEEGAAGVFEDEGLRRVRLLQRVTSVGRIRHPGIRVNPCSWFGRQLSRIEV